MFAGLVFFEYSSEFIGVYHLPKARHWAPFVSRNMRVFPAAQREMAGKKKCVLPLKYKKIDSGGGQVYSACFLVRHFLKNLDA